MHITAYCPECQDRYQLDADLRGRKMRCKNAACQAIFVVREATGGSPRDGTNGPRTTDARGNLVPLTGDRPRRPTGVEPVELDWRAAPPPVQPGGSPPKAPVVDVPPARGSVRRESVQPMKAPPPRIREWEPPSPSGRRRGLFLIVCARHVGGRRRRLRNYSRHPGLRS